MPTPPSILILMPDTTYRRLYLEEELGGLRDVGNVLTPHPCRSLDDPAVASELENVEIIVTGWGTPRLNASDRARLPNLRLVAHSAGSVKFILDPGLLGPGVRATSSASVLARPVAEYTLAYILLENKGVEDWIRNYRNERSRFYKYTDPWFDKSGNAEKTVGIVGASRVGRHVLDLLKTYDLRVLLYDPLVSEAEAESLGARLCPLDELLRESDIVSLHAPAVPATRHMIGAAQFGLMRDGSVLINTARGAVVDQDAMIAELKTNRIRAVIDVTEPEPLPDDCPLFDLPNVVLTPHIAGAHGAEVRKMTKHVIAEVKSFVETGVLREEVMPTHWDLVA